ncbi:hypothetical protein [Desulfonema magnum]|uniref:Uncharacterized protein n=1 Tax=Desulfonema magnum TaxID=45655 RepID=A0A975BI61_9BACT|nr:hypothetical protein [Desulfonema magnum]QTA85758.1 Uncharacterized protein dnm_017720 [Desulfonema magnum]
MKIPCVFLLRLGNYEQSTAGELSKDSSTIPSAVRREQYENPKAFIEKIQNDEEFVKKWPEVEKKNIFRKRKVRNDLIKLN